MGAWGSSLYANDTSSDVRDAYMGFLKDQLSKQEAYDKTVSLFGDCINDPDEAPLFWYALADTQWQVGRLMPEVKVKALEWIKEGGGLKLWEDSKSGSTGWQKTLDKLQERLETEQRKEKKIRKHVVLNQNLWDIGDVYAYQFHTEESKKYGVYEKYMVLQKIGADSQFSEDDVVMRVHVFDKLFDSVPSMDDLCDIRLLPLDSLLAKQELRMSSWLQLHKKKEYPVDRLTYIGNMEIPANNLRYQIWRSNGYWDSIERWGIYFQRWHGIEYETVKEGVFKYTHPEGHHIEE